MALGQKVQLTLEDGTEVITAYDGRDLRAWEAKTGQSALGVKITYSMLTFWGWSAAKRDGSLNGEFDRYEAFDAVCVAVTGVQPDAEDEQPPDPSDPPASATPKEVSGG